MSIVRAAIGLCNRTNNRSSFVNISIALHGKNDFVERSKILLDTDLKIILLDHQNNFVGILK